MILFRFSPVLALALATAACDGEISVTFATGAQEFSLSADGLLPQELRESDGTIIAVPCGAVDCPTSDEVAISCVAGSCDPDAFTYGTPVGDVIDVEALLGEASEVGLNVVDRYEILSINYEVDFNSLSFDVEPIALLWGPENATEITSAGVQRFGTVAALPASSTVDGEVEIDGGGSAALSTYILNTQPRIRFLASTEVDLDSGDAFPEGQISLSVNLTIRAVGRLL